MLFAASLVYAQQASDAATLSLEELLNVKVYTATKYEQKATEAPSSISIITAEEIRHYGYRNLTEALQSITGFYVRNHGSYSTLGVRGFAPSGDSNGRILLLVNGHAINNNIDDSAPFGNDFPIDVDLIDRIEVVRGPSSSLYGADAFFAVVNVITRTGNIKGAMLSGEAGSLGTYKESATYGLEHNGTQALVSASYFDTAAPSHLDKIEDPVGYQGSHDQTRRVFGLVASHGFTMQAAASAAEQRAPESSLWCGSCHQTDTHSTNFHAYTDLQYDRTVFHGTQLTARTYYDSYAAHTNTDDLRGCSEARCHGSLLDYDAAHGDRAGAELKLTHRFLENYRVTAGAEYRDNFRQAQNNYDNYLAASSNPAVYVPVTSTYTNYNRTSALWGIYGEAELRLHPKLILNAGLREDRYNYFVGSKLSPRAALIYTPRSSTTLRFSYGTAFRAPSFAELYYAGMTSVAAPNLRPETIRTFEGGLEQRLSKRVRLNASVFQNDIGSYIEEQTVETSSAIDQTTFYNSKARAKGAELELVGQLSSGAEGRLSYTYQDARNVQSGVLLPDSPKHLVKANIATPLFRRLMTPALEAEYMSRSETIWPSVGYSSPPVLLNATLSSRPFLGGFLLSGSAYNLVGRSMSDRTIGYFEQTHDVAASSLLPEDRRSFRLKLVWTTSERGAKDKSNAPAAESTKR